MSYCQVKQRMDTLRCPGRSPPVGGEERRKPSQRRRTLIQLNFIANYLRTCTYLKHVRNVWRTKCNMSLFCKHESFLLPCKDLSELTSLVTICLLYAMSFQPVRTHALAIRNPWPVPHIVWIFTLTKTKLTCNLRDDWRKKASLAFFVQSSRKLHDIKHCLRWSIVCHTGTSTLHAQPHQRPCNMHVLYYVL